MRFYYREIVAEAHQKAFPQVKVKNLRILPIQRIDFTKRASSLLHDQLCNYVVKIMKTTSDTDFAIFDRQIDNLVYKLYKLNKLERTIIEERNKEFQI
jgi:hypothetical protein